MCNSRPVQMSLISCEQFYWLRNNCVHVHLLANVDDNFDDDYHGDDGSDE